MKLAVCLVLLAVNVQLISCYTFLLPFGNMMGFNNFVQDNEDLNGLYQQPIIYENSGLDQNGNPFFEKQVIQAYQQQLPGQSSLSIQGVMAQQMKQMQQLNDQVSMNDMIRSSQQIQQAPQIMPLIPPESFAEAVDSLFDKTTKAESFILGEPIEQKPLPEKRTRLEFLTPESMLDFNLKVKPHVMPGLGQFHLRQQKYEHDPEYQQRELDSKERELRTEQARKIEHEKFQFEITPVEKDNVAFESLENAGMMNKALTLTDEKDLKGDENNDSLINLEKSVQDKENAFAEQLKHDGIYVDRSLLRMEFAEKPTKSDAERILKFVANLGQIPEEYMSIDSIKENVIVLKVDNVDLGLLCTLLGENKELFSEKNGISLLSCDHGRPEKHRTWNKNKALFIITVALCLVTLSVLIALLSVFVIRRRTYLRQKLIENVSNIKSNKRFDDVESLVSAEDSKKAKFMNKMWPFKTKKVNTQQADLCRSTTIEGQSPLSNTQTTDLSNRTENFESTPVSVDERKGASTRSSASSWSEEPISNVNMDITTGHAILSYMEEHLNDKSRLDLEWVDLCGYEADNNATSIAKEKVNMVKNRYNNILPYDHNRVKLVANKENESDYINASLITDDDPKNPAYIATQGPLLHTTSNFWQMVWEQNSVIIVSLCRTVEYGSSKCNQYWPINGNETYGEFEVHLVSEHVWCEDYLVRSFYLMNKATNQTRTVTQFQFLTWPENCMPPNVKSILDFRRKVNKSYNKKSFPIIVHCNDGIGRTGTYIMIDMILKKIAKEAKEIDLAATLEHLRDQRKDMIKNKNQFEFSFAVITEEVQNMLKTLT